jgi:hypothetical protein
MPRRRTPLAKAKATGQDKNHASRFKDRREPNPGTIKLADDVEPTDDRLLSIPWQKPPSKRFRQILLPHGSSRNGIRPERTGSGRSGRNDASVWSAPSNEADAGWTRLSQVPSLTLNKLPCASNAASAMLT